MSRAAHPPLALLFSPSRSSCLFRFSTNCQPINSSFFCVMGVADPPCSGYVRDGGEPHHRCAFCVLPCLRCSVYYSPQASNTPQRNLATKHEGPMGTWRCQRPIVQLYLIPPPPVSASAGQYLRHRQSHVPGRDGVVFQISRAACLVHLERCSDGKGGRERRWPYGDRAKSEREPENYLYLNCISVAGHLNRTEGCRHWTQSS